MDQCKHCTARENFDKCRQTPCSHRESWGFREAVERAYEAGLIAAEERHSGYSNAHAYFNQTHNAGSQRTGSPCRNRMTSTVQDLVRPAVCPRGMATPYLSPRDAPYRVVIRNGWAHIYKGRHKVWACNPQFAETHFYDMPNDSNERRR